MDTSDVIQKAFAMPFTSLSLPSGLVGVRGGSTWLPLTGPVARRRSRLSSANR